MADAVTNYLKKRAIHSPWSLERPVEGDIQMLVAIPVLAESKRLFLTLGDLARNDPALLSKTIVLCVVNNRVPEIAGADDCADNQRTLKMLPEYAATHPQLRLTWVDASAPGHELGPKEGVGLARKIGLDWGLQMLHDSGGPHAPLICLDADTRVPEDYLTAIHRFFASETRWAAVVDYAHPTEADGEETRAILAYEFFLRYQEMALHYAGSPYHYPAIGSTMACTGGAYAAAGGMNRRQAGEDFYFLQQLAKTGRVERLRETTVLPASRPSHRVPFGTGRKVGAFASDEDDAYLTYHPGTYDVLKAWLEVAQASMAGSGSSLLTSAADIDRELEGFLRQQEFDTQWDRMASQCRTAAQRLRMFHEWFDAFRTLKLTHHLRDQCYPRVDLFEALAVMLGHHGIVAPGPVDASLRQDLDGQRRLLATLREWRPSAPP